MKMKFQNSHVRKLNGDLMEKMHFVGGFCVNDNKKIDHNNLQMMCYIFCYDNFVNAYNSKIQVRKTYFISQNKWYNNFQQTCECKPCHYCKTFEEEVISPLREIVQRQPTKKGLIYLVDKFQFIFVAKVP
jgi:hypothetical protein